jgi:hypothetical protein
MNQQTLTISADLYNRLVAEAQLRGITIERLLEEWERMDSEWSSSSGNLSEPTR